jgi:hypothetical protein
MERHFMVCIGNWAANGQDCRLIENVFADNHRRSPLLLFMAGFWNEIQSNQIALTRNLEADYQTSLP